MKGLMADKEAVSDFLKHPERYDLNKATKRVANVLLASKQSGRGLVAETLEDSIMHELGHHLENFISK